MLKPRSYILVTMAALLALPFISGAVMSGPDKGVSSSWQPGQSASAPQGPINNPILAANGTNTSNGNSLSRITVANTGNFDISAVVTAAETGNTRVALNGFWIEKALIDRIASMNIQGLDRLQAEFSSLGTGDRIRIKGTAANGTIAVTSFEVVHAQALRSDLEARLQALLAQLRELMARQNGTSTSATSTSP